MFTAIAILPADPQAPVAATLALTAGDRQKSRHRFISEAGLTVHLNLPRGSVLRHGDLLICQDQQVLRVVAKPEPVVVVRATFPLALLRAAYHLGNRHGALEIQADCLKFEPDPVLEAMLQQLGGLYLEVAILPFEPETGAYRQGNHHSHG
ncbi:MAG: urease accessory protein UreE [Nodosilinea sp.]|jgi:urease accessory protein